MSEAFLKLSPQAKEIFLYMKDYANGNIEFEFPKSIYSKLVCIETFKKKKAELIEHGFIVEIANGKFTRENSKYKFIDKWKTIKLPNTKMTPLFWGRVVIYNTLSIK